jgi:hypothetical protein
MIDSPSSLKLFFFFQIAVVATITMTVFLRTEMHHDSVTDGNIYAGAMFFGNMIIMFNGLSELDLAVINLPVFYKQRGHLFFPSWAYALPSWIIKIPLTILEVAVWIFLTYYFIGYDNEFGRCKSKFSISISKTCKITLPLV